MDETLMVATKHDLSIHPAKVMVVGYQYKVDFGPQVRPQIHIVNKQRACSCTLKADCPAVDAVAEYLRSGGQRAPDPMPPCPICGSATVPYKDWNGKYTREPGWRCEEGGLTHFLQAKAERIKRNQKQWQARHCDKAAVSEHESEAGR